MSSRQLTTDEKLDYIMRELESIKQTLDNPLSSVSAEEKGQEIGKAIASGDKAKIKAAIKEMNGGR